MAYYLQQVIVSDKFAQCAPRYGTINRTQTDFKDQDGCLHTVHIVKWFESENYELRLGAFDSTTGEYLGEVMSRMSYFEPIRPCPCGSGLPKEAQYDGRGIFLTYTCDVCYEDKMKEFNPTILNYYTQADVDEPIEAED